MRMMMAAAATALLTGCAPTAGDVADRVALAEARPVGEPQSCLPLQSIRSSRVRDDRTIDFELVNGQTYRNVLPYSCPGLGFDESFAYDTSLPRLCSLDTITVLQGGGNLRGATCGLGQFQRVEFPRR